MKQNNVLNQTKPVNSETDLYCEPWSSQAKYSFCVLMLFMPTVVDFLKPDRGRSLQMIFQL